MNRRLFGAIACSLPWTMRGLFALASKFAALKQVDWLYDIKGIMDAKIRSCDFCYESAVDDFMNNHSEPRTFYQEPSGCIVCEHCVLDYLLEVQP